jgi:hypothetical protein
MGKLFKSIFYWCKNYTYIIIHMDNNITPTGKKNETKQLKEMLYNTYK